MALTAIIEAELLAALENGTDPESVLHRYQESKGPLLKFRTPVLRRNLAPEIA